MNKRLRIKMRKTRQANDMDLRDLSVKTGLSVSQLSDIERGRDNFTDRQISLIAGALRMEFEDVLFRRCDN